MKNIIVLGNGFIAQHLSYTYKEYRFDQNDLGESITYIASLFHNYNIDVLINTIGKTGKPNIDWCEQTPENKVETTFSNTTLPLLLAEACLAYKVRFIHIGSGCIFSGKSPNQTASIDTGWTENDYANPQSFYSKTKYAADLAISDFPNTTILRIRMPISSLDHPRNLLNKLRGYQKVIDIPNSMTFMEDLVKCVDWFAHNDLTGIYNVVNPEPLTAAQLMKNYQQIVKTHDFSVIDENELDQITIAKRSNCILSSTKLNQAGFLMTNSKEALENCMAKYTQQLGK